MASPAPADDSAANNSLHVDSEMKQVDTASRTTMETTKYTHKWKIERFSDQQELAAVGDYLESVGFPSNVDDPHRFRLRLFPNGKDEECRGYLSLFLQIQRCPGTRLRFRVNFYIDTTEGPRGCALNRSIVSINKGGIVTASKFFSVESLKQRASRFIPDDTLTIGVDVIVFGEQLSMSSPVELAPSTVELPSLTSIFDDANEKNGLAAAIGSKLYPTMPCSDLTLLADGETFRVHKAIVISRSDYFMAMFSNEATAEHDQSEVVVHDVSAEGMRAVVQYMYTQRVDDIGQVAGEALVAADRLIMADLKLACEQALIAKQVEGKRAEEAVDLLVLADTYSADLLRAHAVDVLRRHKARVLFSSEWTAMQRERPALAAETLRQLYVESDTFTTGSSTPGRSSQEARSTEGAGAPPAKRSRR